MDQMAENTPEVEIETDASEQIPDDVELAEEVETEDGSESSGNDAEEATETDDDESEQEFYFGDEKLDSPTSEDGAEHGLVKHLRKTIKEKDRELKELMRQSQKPVEQQPVITQPPRMPKLDDEDIGFDEEIYQQRMAKWAEDNGKYQQQEMARKQKEQELQAAYQERLSKYQQRVKALKVLAIRKQNRPYSRKSPSRHKKRSCLSQRSRKSLFWRSVATLNCASNWQKLPTS